MLDNFSLDEDTCKTLAITAFENPDIITKQTVLEWLRASCVSNVLVSAAGCVLDQENDLERLWKLLRSALRARRSHPGAKEFFFHFLPKKFNLFSFML